MRDASIRTVVRSQIEIQYLQWGEPQGLPVFLLHGFPDSPVSWRAVARRLEGKGLQLIAPFVRGTGGTTVRLEDHLSGQVAALAADVFTLADALGVDRFYLAGHDWGARTAQAAAVLQPRRVRGIVSLATPYISNRGEPLEYAQVQAYWYQWFFGTMEGAERFGKDPEGLTRALWRAWSPRWHFSRGEFAEAAEAFRNPQFVPIVLHSYRQRWKAAPGLPPYEAAEGRLAGKPPIEVPVIESYGTADACVLPETGRGQSPWFKGPYRRVPARGAGHFIHREKPGLVARLLLQLLRETEAERK